MISYVSAPRSTLQYLCAPFVQLVLPDLFGFVPPERMREKEIKMKMRMKEVVEMKT